MACTTILVGKQASYDGSTIIARNCDSGGVSFTPEKFVVVRPNDQPRHYKSVLSHVELDLPNNPQRYTSVPNAIDGEGIWGESGINDSDVAMTATETITSNERVLGADPLVELQPAQGTPDTPGYVPEVVGGIGEEDFLTLVLPYITSAHEGVLRLGMLLEKYGTYEMNGVGFADADEIWWLETVGGHHWIARRVPDDMYVTMPNQLGIDTFDLDDALSAGTQYLCSSDMRTWMKENHLDLTRNGDGTHFNPREAFGSHSERDHIYNTCRAWYMQRTLNPSDSWDGPNATYRPESDNIAWGRVPERLVTMEDIKFVLSSHYEGTEYDPYGDRGTHETRTRFRPIGINRQSHLGALQIRSYAPEGARGVQWMAFGSNAFNTMVPLYAGVNTTPDYVANTIARVTTDSLYWQNRIIACLADANFNDNINSIDNFQERTMAFGHQIVRETDAKLEAGFDGDTTKVLEAANERICAELQSENDKLLDKVLYMSSLHMRNHFALSDH